jgi:hypothetical protein
VFECVSMGRGDVLEADCISFANTIYLKAPGGVGCTRPSKED